MDPGLIGFDFCLQSVGGSTIAAALRKLMHKPQKVIAIPQEPLLKRMHPLRFSPMHYPNHLSSSEILANLWKNKDFVY